MTHVATVLTFGHLFLITVDLVLTEGTFMGGVSSETALKLMRVGELLLQGDRQLALNSNNWCERLSAN